MSSIYEVKALVQRIFEHCGFEVVPMAEATGLDFACRNSASSSGVAVFDESKKLPEQADVQQLLAVSQQHGLSQLQLISLVPIPPEIAHFASITPKLTLVDHASFQKAVSTLPVQQGPVLDASPEPSVNSAPPQRPLETLEKSNKKGTARNVIAGIFACFSLAAGYGAVKVASNYLFAKREIPAAETVTRALNGEVALEKSGAAVEREEPSVQPEIVAQLPGNKLVVPETVPVSLPAPSQITATGGTLPMIGKAKALIIGNSAYEKAGRLANPGNDAKLISKSLTQRGFEVETHLDLDLRGMNSAIQDFLLTLRKQDLAFFFFSGHGIEVDGQNFLIPIRCSMRHKQDAPHFAYPMTRLMDELERSQCSSKIVVLDACRSNPFGVGTRGEGSGLQSMEAPDGTMIAFATAPGKVALDGRGSNSPFTKHLAKAMLQRPETGKLTLLDCFLETGRKVKTETGQVPWINLEASMNEVVLWEGPIDSAPNAEVEAMKAEMAQLKAQLNVTAPRNEATHGISLPTRGFYTLDEIFEESKYAAFPLERRTHILFQVLKVMQQSGHFIGAAQREMNRAIQGALILYQGDKGIPVDGKLNDRTLSSMGLDGLSEVFVASKGDHFVDEMQTEMRWLPPGKDSRISRRFTGQSEVTLTKGFWLASTEVTERQWIMIMGIPIQELAALNDQQHRSAEIESGSNLPIRFMTWRQAKEYCRKLTERSKDRIPEGWRYDLPSEAQWNYAASGGDQFTLRGDGAWDKGSSLGHYQPVGTRKVSPNGFYDLLGNVSEWVEDYFEEYTVETPVIDYVNRERGEMDLRSVRGGSIRDEAMYASVVDRNCLIEQAGYEDVGFRVALLPPEESSKSD